MRGPHGARVRRAVPVLAIVPSVFLLAALILFSVGAAEVTAQQTQPPGRPAQSATAGAPIDYGTARLNRRLEAVRAAGEITLDGVLNEPAWSDAPVASNFVQNDPREGEPATFDTEVRVLYDDDAMYFGVFAKDDEPGRIIVNDIKKDFNTGSSDGFRVILDTFHDERNGYQFATNPAGAKWDSQMSNEGRENNANWDGIWDVATSVTEAGWYAEIRIPFRTVKFSTADVQSWGVNFERKLRRFNEDSYWSPLPRIYDLDRVSLAGTVEGMRGLRPGRNLRFKPYAASSSNTTGGGRTRGDVDAGFDVKYGITTGLVWDFTVNTDFSQVEADEQQINLSRFSLFFPEKRDFFLENSGIFEFGGGGGFFGGGGGGGGRSGDMRLFFSRRIGLSENGAAIPLLAGTRLTGRQGPYSVGALNIQQREQEAVPSTNFTVLRLRRNILAQSDIGAVLLNKEEIGPHDNRVFGLDANFRFGFLNLNGYAVKTFFPRLITPGTGNEYAMRAGFTYDSRAWQLQGSFSGIGERFNDEMGFVPRRGVNNFDGRLGPRLRPAALSKWVRQTQPHIEFDIFTRQHDGRLESRYLGYHWGLNLQNGSNGELGVNTNSEEIHAPFSINTFRGIRVNSGRYDFAEAFMFWNTNPAARVSLNSRVSTGPFYDGYRRGYVIGPSVRLNENFNASVNLQINDIEVSTGAFVSKLLATRVNYNFNTRMFVNAFVQYNSDSRQWTSNVRFNIIHRPLSDFYLVYNEHRDDRTGDLLTRAVIAKMTYLVAF
jgi:hypothetical protein